MVLRVIDAFFTGCIWTAIQMSLIWFFFIRKKNAVS